MEFAKNRTQFGLPISEYEVIQFKLADMAMKIQALQYLVYHSAAHQDRMGPDPKKWSRLERLEKTKEASIAKCLGSEWASEVIDEALQIHGGIGYIRGTPIERAYRDARISEIFEGTNEIQRVVVARDLLARGLGGAARPIGRGRTRRSDSAASYHASAPERETRRAGGACRASGRS